MPKKAIQKRKHISTTLTRTKRRQTRSQPDVDGREETVPQDTGERPADTDAPVQDVGSAQAQTTVLNIDTANIQDAVTASVLSSRRCRPIPGGFPLFRQENHPSPSLFLSF